MKTERTEVAVAEQPGLPGVPAFEEQVVLEEQKRGIHSAQDLKRLEPEKYARVLELHVQGVTGRAIEQIVRAEFPRTGISRNSVASILRDALRTGGLAEEKKSAMVEAALVSRSAKERIMDLLPSAGANHLMALNAIAGTMHDKAFGQDVNVNITIGSRESETARRTRMSMDEILEAMPRAGIVSTERTEDGGQRTDGGQEDEPQKGAEGAEEKLQITDGRLQIPEQSEEKKSNE